MSLPFHPLFRLNLRAELLIAFAMTASSQLAAQSPYYNSPAGASGVQRYDPRTWGVVEVQLANPGRQSKELLSVMAFRDHADRQFGKRTWVPANARRTTWFPVLTPAVPPAEGKSWSVQSFLFEGDSQETAILARTGEMQMDSYLLLGRGLPLTGLIADPDDMDELTHLLWAARLSRNLPKSVVWLEWERLPPTVESLDGLDQLLVASNQVLSHPATCAAIRNWLHRGGRLWLYLNAVDPDTIGALVGDALQISVVDRVQRDRLQVSSHELRTKQPSGPELQLDHPVELLRVMFSQAQPSHTVDDWPVAAWTTVGRGALLVTTLSAPAWLRARTPSDQLPNTPDDRNDHVQYLATEPLLEVASQFFIERNPPAIAPHALQDNAAEQIGYSIVGRPRVAAVLGVFCAGFALVGIVLARRRMLEQLGWIGPLAAVIASAVLLSIGHASREAVPRTVVMLQTAEVSPFSEEIQVSGLATTYSADKSADLRAASAGGVFWPELGERDGQVLRMISTDRHRWELRNLTMPAGQQSFPLTHSYQPTEPVRAVCTFGADGLEGTIIPGPFEGLADAVLAMPSTRNLAVELRDGGRFAVAADAVLAPGEFLTGPLLTDEQRRRSRILELLSEPQHGTEAYPAQPTLLLWAKPLDLGFQILSGAQHTGSTLVSLPLRLVPPAPGTAIQISGPFVRYRPVGAAQSVTFDERRRRWVGPLPTGVETTLQFQLPSEVLPIRVTSATLTISIRALSRELQIIGFAEDQPVLLESSRSPLGTVEFPIDREDVLRVNDAGELMLGINVSDIHDDEGNRVLDPSDAQQWRIDDVQLSISGMTGRP